MSKTRATKRMRWALAGTLTLLTFPCMQAHADDTSAATLAFRPAIEKARSASLDSEAPGLNTPTSSSLAFRPSREQEARVVAGSEPPTSGATAAELAFRPRGVEPVIAPEAASSYSIAYRRSRSESK